MPRIYQILSCRLAMEAEESHSVSPIMTVRKGDGIIDHGMRIFEQVLLFWTLALITLQDFLGIMSQDFPGPP